MPPIQRKNQKQKQSVITSSETSKTAKIRSRVSAMKTVKTSGDPLISVFDLLTLKPSVYYGCLVTIVVIHFAPLYPRAIAFVRGVFAAVTTGVMLLAIHLLNAVKVNTDKDKIGIEDMAKSITDIDEYESCKSAPGSYKSQSEQELSVSLLRLFFPMTMPRCYFNSYHFRHS